MVDIIAPILIIGLIVGVIVAIVVGAKRQRGAAKQMYADYAQREGYAYAAVDDGRVAKLAKGFGGFGVFESASLGEQVAEHVISGQVDEGALWVFLHHTRQVKGEARSWYVCLVETGGNLCDYAAIQIKPVRYAGVSKVSGAAVVAIDDAAFGGRFEVRGDDGDSIRAILDESVRRYLLESVEGLPFKVGIQIKGRCVAVYLSDRNADLESVGNLGALVSFTQQLCQFLNR